MSESQSGKGDSRRPSEDPMDYSNNFQFINWNTDPPIKLFSKEIHEFGIETGALTAERFKEIKAKLDKNL